MGRGLGEHIVDLAEARAPQVFELDEECPSSSDLLRVGPNDPLATALLFRHETCLLQHGDVLLHCGEAHVVIGSELADRRLADQSSAHDVAPRRIGKCSEQAVDLVVGQS